MNPAIIAFIAILIAVGCTILAIRYGKSFFKIFGVVFFVLFIGVIIYSALIINDAVNFNDGINHETSAFLLKNDDKILAGVSLKPIRKSTGGDFYQDSLQNRTDTLKDVEAKTDIPYAEIAIKESSFSSISNDKLESFNEKYLSEDFDNIASGYYKVLLFNKSLFQSEEQIVIGEIELSMNEALEIIEAEDSLSQFIHFSELKYGLLRVDAETLVLEYVGSDIESRLFSYMVLEVMGEEDIRSISKIILLLEDDQLKVYPESVMFRILKGMPYGFVENVIRTFQGSSK